MLAYSLQLTILVGIYYSITFTFSMIPLIMICINTFVLQIATIFYLSYNIVLFLVFTILIFIYIMFIVICIKIILSIALFVTYHVCHFRYHLVAILA